MAFSAACWLLKHAAQRTGESDCTRSCATARSSSALASQRAASAADGCTLGESATPVQQLALEIDGTLERPGDVPARRHPGHIREAGIEGCRNRRGPLCPLLQLDTPGRVVRVEHYQHVQIAA